MNIAIIGVGLIGGSLGLAFKNKLPRSVITGYGRSIENLNTALEMKAIDKIGGSFADISDADIVIICTPVGKIPDIIKSIKRYLKPDAIVTDVGSTKGSVVKDAEKQLKGICHFIGGHPMAGSEQQGVESSSKDLFHNACYILTPTGNTDPDSYRRLHTLIAHTKAVIVALDPTSHDRIVASISHLPHVISAALVNSVIHRNTVSEDPLFYAAGGFRDTTRIAASQPEIWVDICLENKKAILESLNCYLKELSEFKKALREQNRSELKKKFTKAREGRLKLPASKRAAGAELVQITIFVKDKPGVIMEVSLILGKLGVNIENIELLHASGSEGTLLLSVVRSANLEKAIKQLNKSGYKVQSKS